MPALRAVLLRALALAVPLSFVGASCGQGALGIMPGVINDTHNLSLRRAILAEGKGKICAEVQARSLAIRPRDDAPAIGRFMPLQCYARDLPNGEIYLQLGGRGYVWTNVSQRVGFEAGIGVNYDVDFQLDGSTMYLYLRPRAATAPAFATKVVENPQAAFFGGMATTPSGQKMTDAFGASIMSSQLTRGFTVIRKPDGTIEMGLGVIPPGGHPMAGIATLDRDKPVLLNDRSELRPNQRDFIPLEVPPGSKLTLLVGVAGPGVDVLLLPRAAGEAWLGAYATQAVTTPPPAQPFVDEPVDPGPIWRRTVAVPPGAYYLVLDNTPSAGRRAPAASGDQPAVVSYGAELE
ncbi:MAG: hypothetical protein QM820_56635 [Minicystis sp.]